MDYGVITDANQYSGQPERWRAAVRDMKAHGLTFAMSPTGSLATLGMMLGVCDQEGLGLHCAAALELDREWWPSSKGSGISRARQMVDRYVRPLLTHPSFRGHYLFDEPAVDDAAGLSTRIRNLTHAIREVDTRPVFSTIRNEAAGVIVLLQTGPDAAVPFWYPLTVGLAEQSADDLGNEPYLDDVLTAKPQEIPLWLIVQAHSGEAFNLRAPSPGELRAQVMNAERLGAEQVVFFAYESQEGGFVGLKDNLQLWAEVGRITGSLPRGSDGNGETREESPPPPPPPLPPPPSSVGVPRPTIPNATGARVIKEYWATHPLNLGTEIQTHARTVQVDTGSLQSAVDTNPNGTTFVLSAGVSYDFPRLIGRSGIHIVGQGQGEGRSRLLVQPGAAIAPANDALRYHTSGLGEGIVERVQRGDPVAINWITTERSRDILFDTLIVDHQAAYRGVSLAACDGILWRNVKFVNGGQPASETFHAGHLNGNACLDHMYFVDVEFAGGFRHPVYLDGVHSMVFLRCRYSAKYAGSGAIFLANNDMTADLDRDGRIALSEGRISRFVIASGCVMDHYHWSLIECTGGPMLVEESRGPSTEFVWMGRKSNDRYAYDQRGVVVRNNRNGTAKAFVLGPEEHSAGSVPVIVGDLEIIGNDNNLTSGL